MRRLGHADIQTTLEHYGWVTEDAELRPRRWRPTPLAGRSAQWLTVSRRRCSNDTASASRPHTQSAVPDPWPQHWGLVPRRGGTGSTRSTPTPSRTCSSKTPATNEAGPSTSGHPGRTGSPKRRRGGSGPVTTRGCARSSPRCCAGGPPPPAHSPRTDPLPRVARRCRSPTWNRTWSPEKPCDCSPPATADHPHRATCAT